MADTDINPFDQDSTDKDIDALIQQLPDGLREIQKKLTELMVKKLVEQRVAGLEKEVQGFKSHIEELNKTIENLKGQVETLEKAPAGKAPATPARPQSKYGVGSTP